MPEVCSDHHPSLAAIAHAKPKRAAARGISLLSKDCPAVKSLAVQSDLSGVFSHD